MLIGCGGQATPPAANALAVPASALEAKDAGAPGSALRRYWGAAPNHNIKIYGDLGGLLHTDLFAQLVPGLMHIAGDSLGPKQQACASAVLAGAKELGVSGGENDGLFLLGFDPKGLDEARTACVGTVVSPERVTVAGASEAYAMDGSDVLAVDHGVVLLGSRELVTAALAPHNPGPWPKELTLAPEQRLAAVVNVEGISARSALFVGPQRFRLEIEGQAPSEEMAQGAEAGVLGLLRQVRGSVKDPKAPEAAALSTLLDAFTITRRGKEMTGVFELKGQSAKAQAELLGTAVALGVYGAKRYVARAKMAEAYTVINIVARNFVDVAASANPPLKKLFSLPPVPTTVPRGEKYQSSVADWKAWAPIKFSIDEPQYYQYEVVAAKDGKSAEVIARGDLDGNGKQSRLSLKLTLDAKAGTVMVSTVSPKVGPGIEETDPME